LAEPRWEKKISKKKKKLGERALKEGERTSRVRGGGDVFGGTHCAQKSRSGFPIAVRRKIAPKTSDVGKDTAHKCAVGVMWPNGMGFGKSRGRGEKIWERPEGDKTKVLSSRALQPRGTRKKKEKKEKRKRTDRDLRCLDMQNPEENKT